MSSSHIPGWVNVVVLPLLNLLAALAVSGVVIAAVGENPFDALGIMLKGAFVTKGSLGYTLFYTTNFIFTGLAVAVAFHAGLFNIGGEGQAALGGLGVGLLVLALQDAIPPVLIVLLCIPAAAGFGAVWGSIPGYLQAKRGSHIVITTIMFNFIAASIMVWLLAGMLKAPGQMSPESPSFNANIALPKITEIAAFFGVKLANSPLNLAFVVALIVSFLVWVLIWRTRLGYRIRTVGFSLKSSVYAGYRPDRIVIIAMAISGALAGMMALNEILGVQHKVILNFTSGYGFAGIAVALMGRNHPVGILFASLLFGALYQGGAELDFEFRTITREMVLVIQGLIILFSGALAYMFNPAMERLFFLLKAERTAHG